MDLKLEGAYNVERANELRDVLLEALKAEGDISLSFAEVTEADLTFFNLLHALRKSCESEGKHVIMQADLPGGMAQRAAWTGFAEIIAG